MEVAVTTLKHKVEQVILPEPQYEMSSRGMANYGPGVWITGVFVDSSRIVLRTYSVWEPQTQQRYREVSPTEYLRVCSLLGLEPRDLRTPPEVPPLPMLE